jgi:hypothetical protein
MKTTDIQAFRQTAEGIEFKKIMELLTPAPVKRK